MRIIFCGADSFAIPILNGLLKAKDIEIALIITRPAKPAGRGLQPEPNPVLAYAKHTVCPISLIDKSSDWSVINKKIKSLHPDLAVVAALGRLIPADTLKLLPQRFINVHPSLLPKYRGPAPIEAPILASDNETGVSFIILDQRMDAGPIIFQEEVALGHTESACHLKERLSILAAERLPKILKQLLDGKLVLLAQKEAQATYTSIITKKDGYLTLKERPETIERLLRAYVPWPGVTFTINGQSFKIIKAHLRNNKLVIDIIQPANKRAMSGREFANGYHNLLTKLPPSIIINPLVPKSSTGDKKHNA